MKKSDRAKVTSAGHQLDLDFDIAIKVMGFGHLKLRKVPKYSSDLNEAMKVVDQMRKNGHLWIIVSCHQGYFLRHLANETHDAIRDEKLTCDRPMAGSIWPQTATQLAKAICLAALEETARGATETSRELSRKD